MADTLFSRLRARAESLFLMEESGSWSRRRLIRLGRLGYITVRETIKDHLPDRAASLSFTTMVSLIPTAILLFFLFSSEFEVIVDNFKEQVRQNLQAPPGSELPEGQQSVADKVESWLGMLEKELKTVEGARVQTGGIALIVLLFAVSSLFRSAERNFSLIWNAEGSRGFFRKLGVYWMMLTLPPLILVAARFVRLPLDKADQDFLSWVVGVSVSFFAFVLVFAYLPNARVKIGTAAIGALVAAAAWEVGFVGFALYLQFVAASSIYGALGVVPVFLMFVFYGWCLALMCSELTYCLQNYEVLDREFRFSISRQRVTSPVCALLCMETVYRGFRSAEETVTAHTVAKDQQVPLTLVESVLEKLAETDLVVTTDGGAITPTRAAEKLSLATVVEIFPEGSGLHVSDGLVAASPLARFVGGLGDRVDQELASHSFADYCAPGPYKADTPRTAKDMHQPSSEVR